MTAAEDELREFFATAPLDVAAAAVSVSSLVRVAQRRRRRRAAAAALALTGVVATVAVTVVSAAGLAEQLPLEVAEAPRVPGIDDVDHLDVITPTDVGGLAIGMTLAEVQEREDVDVTMLEPGAACAARIAVGETVRGYLEEWPERDGEVVVTALVYYGTDARTTGGAAVGRMFDDWVTFTAEAAMETPLGDGVTVLLGSPAAGRGPDGIGYQVRSSCQLGRSARVGTQP